MTVWLVLAVLFLLQSILKSGRDVSHFASCVNPTVDIAESRPVW